MLTVAVYQGKGDSVSENIKSTELACKKASEQGADIIVFPELFYCAYGLSSENLQKHAITASQLTSQLSSITSLFKLTVVMPYAEKYQDEIYNSALIVDWLGNFVHNYRKCNLWGKYENENYKPGDNLSTFKITTKSNLSITAGCIVCYDVEFPEPARTLALQGAKLLIVPTALGCGPADEITPFHIVPTRACENLMFVLYSNYIGKGTEETASWTYCGKSAIVAPDGSVIARANATDEDLLIRKLDLKAYEAYEKRNPYLSDVKEKTAAGIYKVGNKSRL